MITAKQHDLFRNPSRSSRATFPLLVLLQSDYVEGTSSIVAPLIPHDGRQIRPTNKAALAVVLDRRAFLVMLPLMASIDSRRLREPVGSIAGLRDDITRGLDWLLSGL